jgi:excisionase family DNA binding protein
MTERPAVRAVELRTYVVERPVVETQTLHVLLKVEQVCALLQVSDDTLARWAKDGKLVPFKDGATVRYVYADIEAFLERGKEPPA